MRAMHVTVFSPVLQGLTQWAVYETNPYAVGSCEPDGVAQALNICAALGMGYVILEFVIPLVILILITVFVKTK